MDPPTRVMLWSMIRSRSTVFEMAMASVPSFQIFHEPYAIANVFGEERSVTINKPPIPGYSYAEVVSNLQADFPGKTAVFAKDFPQSLQRKMAYLPTGYIHTFLVRDPLKAGPSHFKAAVANTRHLRDEETAKRDIAVHMNLNPTLDLYNYVIDVLQQKPIVIDSDDLVSAPREIVTKYCSETGLPFYESMLSWKPGNTTNWFPEFLKEPFVNYFKVAMESSEFMPPDKLPKKAIPDEEIDVPEEIFNVIESNKEIYQELCKHKLQI